MTEQDKTEEPVESLETQSDAELLRRSRDGDAIAFGQLWERYRSLAMSVAASLTTSDAEDVVSEAFTVLWDKIRSGEGPAEAIRGYLLATVRNLSHRTYRRTGRVLTGIEHELELEPVEDDTEAIEREELVRDVQVAFDALPPRWKKVIWKSEVELLPRAQVAKDLSLSPNSTSQLLRRAKEALRVAWLNERFVHSPDDEHYTYIKDLPRYVRRGLPQTRRTKLQAHLADCDSCRAKESQLRREDAFLASAVALLPLVGGAAWVARQSSVLVSGPMAAVQGRLAELSEWSRTLVHWGYVRVATIAGTAVVALIMGAVALLAPSSPAPDAPTGPPQPPTAEEGDTSTHSQPAGQPAAAPVTPSASAENSATSDAPQPGVTGPTVVSPTGDGQAQEPERQIASPTIGFGGDFARTLPPLLVGTGEPGAELHVLVSGGDLRVAVGGDGRWAVDLASLGLGLGMHSARAVQYVDAIERSSAVLNFDLTLPQVTVVSQESGSEGPRAELHVAGVSGQRVCLLSDGRTRGSIMLGADGTAIAKIAAVDYANGLIGFAYCDGTKVGPEGQVWAW
ncbi:sigma-70 family RNA polymerase sigma factor [Leucobacter aridicollis]|uniref:sigma-70 family RNA polymerase sigma factor n=1 Tax=Leucobacter aridicollis TaxID=283878 RepID=UPI00210247FE|nr:sigma-70 family RNA polymerase sigma factor [Leucobacter aridicollis]UTX52628.1 sigma-70 family RNA polymerase sigma factor [Leucobacter aridicollis]